MPLPSFDILARAAVSTLAISVPTVVDALRERVDPRVVDRRLDRWSRALLAHARVRLTRRGVDHITPGASYVVMSNHQSIYDIPVLYQALPLPLRMAAKSEIFRVPVWAPAMRAAGIVELDRKNGRRALASLVEARHRLQREGTSLWLAPEGRRSPDGALLPFKRGGFQLALVAALPILPVSIHGSIDVHRSGSYVVHREREVVVQVGAPIDTASFGRKRLGALAQTVAAAIAGPLGLEPPVID